MDDFLHNVWKSILEYWFLIAMVANAVAMSIFSTAHRNGKVDWLESVMCALFAYGVWFVLSWLNFPEGVGVLLGGLIGYKGTHATSRWISAKLGIDMDKK